LSFRKENLSSKISLFAKATPAELVQEFGGAEELQRAYYELQESLYVE
jgi:hypothetical protein